MQKWDYVRYYWNYQSNHSSHYKYESIQQMIDDYGGAGWELISVVPVIESTEVTNGMNHYLGSNPYSCAEILYFKRTKE